MDLAHIHAFTAAMQRKDLEAMLSHMADDIVLKSPLVADPLRGKAALRPVVRALLGVVDAFDFCEILEGPRHVASFFRVAVGSVELDGMDYWRLNDAGLIQEMTSSGVPCPRRQRCNASSMLTATRLSRPNSGRDARRGCC
jgi:hypothetical protein